MECTTVEQGDVGIVACEGEEVREILGVGEIVREKVGDGMVDADASKKESGE